MTDITGPGIQLSGGGLCPVQFEGTIDNCEAYFRSRYTTWILTVARDGDDPAWTTHPDGPLWEASGPYDPNGSGYGAGYMDPAEAERLILDAVAAWRAARAERD